VRIAATGGSDASIAALLSHQVDADMAATETALLLEEKQQGRIVTEMEKYAPNFITQVVFTRQPLVADKPEFVERFLRGLFASIAFVKSHKGQTVDISSAVLHLDKTLTARIYDDQLSILSDDGQFEPKAMAVLKDSFVDLGILTEKPSDDQILTTRFLPVKP
jgi:ABC-type nitrate/sulfonate/bicarbonate transport system substrate-binding protein